MKTPQICACVLLLIMGSAIAFADGINDPKIIIQSANGTSIPLGSCEGCKNVGLNFTFGVPASGTGELFFTNASGVNWTSLTLVEQGHQIPAIDIKCHSSLFMSCTARDLKNGNVAIVLSGIKGGNGPDNPDKGIGNGQSFSIGFSCVGKSCWPGGLDFGAHANTTTVPEPGTIALMVTGLGTLISRRKLWRNCGKA
jgi:hypothetical protein